MAQPTPYKRSFSFTNAQEDDPDKPLPGTRLDIELDNISESSKALTAVVNASQTVIDNMDSVVTVADDIDNVVFVAENMPEIRDISADIEQSKTDAADSAQASANFALAASGSAAAAAGSATSASGSASAASASAGASATSAGDAQGFAAAAAGSASAAQGHAVAAAASASAASGSATAAGNSALAAAGSAAAAQDALEDFNDITATATKLPSNAQPTVTFTPATGLLAFGIPAAEGGGDMQQSDYDPDFKAVNVYDMDNMEDGTARVAMTVGERAAVAGAVRHDTAQSLTSGQKQQARTNIGVDAALVGSLNAALAYGAIGTYIMARCSLGNVPEGNSVAGSTLNPAGGFSSLWINSVPQTYEGIAGAALTGVWQCHGRIWSYDDSVTSIGTATLFKRTG